MTLVLVDTSSWIHMLRATGDEEVRHRVESLLESGAACWCPIVRLELWNGAGERDRKMLLDFEKTLTELPITEEVWDLALQPGTKNQNRWRKRARVKHPYRRLCEISRRRARTLRFRLRPFAVLNGSSSEDAHGGKSSRTEVQPERAPKLSGVRFARNVSKRSDIQARAFGLGWFRILFILKLWKRRARRPRSPS